MEDRKELLVYLKVGTQKATSPTDITLRAMQLVINVTCCLEKILLHRQIFLNILQFSVSHNQSESVSQ